MSIWHLVGCHDLFWGDRYLPFVTEISGIVWIPSYDWLMVAFGNHQPIVTNAGYLNDPRKLVLSLLKVSEVVNSQLSA